MMRLRKCAAVLLAATAFALASPVRAEEAMQGTVKAVEFSSLRVIEFGHWSEEVIKVNSDTTYEGVDNLKGFAVGDQVVIKYTMLNGSKVASSIQKLPASDAQPETLFQSPETPVLSKEPAPSEPPLSEPPSTTDPLTSAPAQP